MAHEPAAEAGASPRSEPTPRPESGRPDLVIALLLAAVVFGWNYRIERDFDRIKVLSEYDVFFNADPITRIDSISHGKGLPNEMVIHPGFKVYFSRPIRAAAKVARAVGWVGNTGRDEYQFRRALGLTVIPAVSGLTMAVAYGLFLGCGLPRRSSLLMTLLCCCSFSQLIFGSVPDHMPVTGLSFALLLALAQDMAKSGGAVRWRAWAIAGGLTIGVTITNAAPFVLAFGVSAALSGRSKLRAVRDTVLVGTASLAVAGVVFLAGRYLCKDVAWPENAVSRHASSYLKNDWAKAPAALLDTFAPSGFVRVPMPPRIRESNRYSAGRDDPTIYTAPNPPTPLVALVTALTLTGAAGCWRAGTPMRAVGGASVAIVAFNLALFSVWGDGFFLYSQHSLVALGVLLAGNLTWPGVVGRGFSALYALGGLAMFFHNCRLLNEILASLGGTPW